MTGAAADLGSGKGHRDENFPVASALLKPEHRAPIMAFYRFARTADDVADHPEAGPSEKLRLLEAMRATLSGESDDDKPSLVLRHVLLERSLSPSHGLDLLEAFRRDVTVTRYTNWAELIDYCRYSAMPVGRFVLDVHGEDRSTWAASDALCAALQIINHLQDCGKDYRVLDRVYIPTDDLAAAGETVAALGKDRASSALRQVISGLAGRTAGLLGEAVPLAGQIRSRRLALEVAIIQRLAVSLTGRLRARDPLSERVHHRTIELFGLVGLAMLDRISGGMSRMGS